MDNRKKIIWISSCPPSNSAKEAGGQTFCFYFKKFLESNKFDIRLISLGDWEKAENLIQEFSNIRADFVFSGGPLKNKLKKIINIDSMFNPLTRYAGLISNYCAMEMLRILKGYKKEGYKPDYIILEWTNTVVMAKQIKKIYPKCRMVASEHDVTYVGYKRKVDYYTGFRKVIWKIKYHHERKVELDTLKLCNMILPQNSDNMELLKKDGISSDKLQWLVPYFHNMDSCIRTSNGKDILFYGAMARKENYLSAIWFIQNVMPMLEDLDVRFVVLGSNPPQQLKEYESDRVCITGFVDSIEPYFQRSMCLVAPLVLGAGIKVKILEAMSSGIPVLTNNLGIEGIPAKDGIEYFHCETPKEFEMKIRQIHNHWNEEKMSEEQKRFIGKTYSVEKSFVAYKNKLLSWEK